MTPAVFPFLRPWSKTTQNRCSYEDITLYWQSHDAITFLINLGVYRPAFYDLLTKDEKEQVLRYKSRISQQRFVTSRTILKNILSKILVGENIADITLTKNAGGRILVKDTPHVYLSLSYYGKNIAITVGKTKLGSDIEGVRSIRDTKITASPIFQRYPCTQGKEHMQQVIHVWTLVESYAKLFDRNPYLLLSSSSLLEDADFVSYYINHHMILSLASAREHITEVLVWLDV